MRCHRPGGPAKFWKVYQLRCQILIAAARAANSESCQILKGATAAANFRPCQISMAAAIWARSQILPCVAAAFDVANCRTQFVQSEPTKIMSKILVLKKIFPNA